jgi:hypothetical protein
MIEWLKASEKEVLRFLLSYLSFKKSPHFLNLESVRVFLIPFYQ